MTKATQRDLCACLIRCPERAIASPKHRLDYCPLHKAAYALKEALEDVVVELDIALGYVRAAGSNYLAKHGSGVLIKARSTLAPLQETTNDQGSSPS